MSSRRRTVVVPARLNARRAFTMAELLVAVSIIAILAAVVAPSFYSLARSRESQGVIGDLAQTLRLAQERAVLSRIPLSVVIDIDRGTYWIVRPMDPRERDHRRSRQRNLGRFSEEGERLYAQSLPPFFQFGSVYYTQQDRSVLDGMTPIRFFPDGSATGAAILVQREDTRAERVREDAILVDGRTGRVRQMSRDERVELFGAENGGYPSYARQR